MTHKPGRHDALRRAARTTGHPESVEAIVKLDEDTIATGSSDGMIRVVAIQPNKLLGVLGEHAGVCACALLLGVGREGGKGLGPWRAGGPARGHGCGAWPEPLIAGPDYVRGGYFWHAHQEFAIAWTWDASPRPRRLSH